MPRRYLVLSDLHLCDVEDHEDGWMAHKSARYVFDDEIGALLRRFVASAKDDRELVLILNGDVFDFDLISAVPKEPKWPIKHRERTCGLDATASKSAWKLERVLDHHPRFVAALGAFLAHGHRVVYVLGNHDRELHFPEVRDAFVKRIDASVVDHGATLQDDQLRIEPWFYYVPGELYAEHGNQYDYHTSFRYLLEPTVPTRLGATIALPMGNLSNRILMNRMGFFNPHASDYILNLFRYVTHWVQNYAFSKRSLASVWFWGSLATVGRLISLKSKLRHAPPEHRERVLALAQRFAIDRDTVKQLEQLQRPPITERFFRIFRELWIDRMIVAGAMIVGTVVLALVPIPLWIKLMVPLSSFPLIFLIYEWLAEGETIFTVEQKLPKYARAIAALLPVRVVTFGHTHKPRMIPLDHDLTFVDTGTWAPIMKKMGKRALVSGYRNYAIFDFASAGGQVSLACWSRGEHAEAEAPNELEEA